MTNDILDEVRRFRPHDADLERRWPTGRRADLTDRIEHSDPHTRRLVARRPRSRRGRVLAASMLAAAAIAAALTVPALLPESAPGAASPAAAAALHRLARVAAGTAVDEAGPDQFVHTVVRERQVGKVAPSDQVSTLVSTVESWTGSDGRMWRCEPAPGDPHANAEFYPASDGITAYLASLPTDADDLKSYLRAHVSGSDSTDEAVFVAIGDMLRGQTASAGLRAAAMTVLAETNHVTLGPTHTDVLGRPVTEFDFVDNANRPDVVETLFFDPRTAELIDERTTAPDSVSMTTVLETNVVDSVPTDVVRTAKPQK